MAKKNNTIKWISGGVAAFLLFTKIKAAMKAEYLDYKIGKLKAIGLSKPLQWAVNPTVDMDIDIINPTNENFTFNGFNGYLYYEGGQIGTVNSSDSIAIPAAAVTRISSRVKLSGGSAIKTIISAITGGKEPVITIKGTLNFIGLKLPVNKQIPLTI